MAIPFKNNLDIGQNQLLFAVLQKDSSAPSTPAPVAGQIYYNTSTGRAYYYNGSAWVGMDSEGATMTGANIIDAINAENAKTINEARLTVTHPTKTSLGLDQVTNNKQVNAMATASVDGYVPTWDGVGGDKLKGGYEVISDLSADLGATAKLATAQGVKTYVDGHVPSYADINAVTGLALALGNNSVADNSGIAIGIASFSEANNSIAIGGQSEAFGASSIAIGASSKATEMGSIAIGVEAVSDTPLTGVFGYDEDFAEENKLTLMTWLFNGKVHATETEASDGDSTVVTKGYVDSVYAATDAMRYKGAIDASSNPAFPTSPKKGDTHKISVSGTIGGVAVEAGDMIIALVDKSGATIAADWNIIQANIDGAVIGPSSATNNRIAVFDNSANKIKDSGKTTADFSEVGHTHPYASKYSANLTASATQTVTHGLNTEDVVVMIRESAGDKQQVFADVKITGANTISITMATAPTANQYRVTVIG